MKFTRFILFPAFFVMLSLAAKAESFNMNDDDKQMHALASFSIASISYGAARASQYSRWTSVLFSSTLTIAVGHIKESTDSRYDKGDMLANLSGMTLGLLLPISFSF